MLSNTIMDIVILTPIQIVLAGVAGGVKDVAIGDIVIGTKFYGYEFGKETPGGFVTRPEGGYYSKELIISDSIARLIIKLN